MASIKLGPTVSDIRGSIGGVTFSRNGGGPYARTRVKGTNPNSAPQQVVRSIMATMSLAWTALTLAVRTGWDNYAKNVQLINRLGDSINVSGWNMYCRTKAVMDLIGGTMPATAPASNTLAEQDADIAVTGDVSDNKLSVVFNTALPWVTEVGAHLLVYQGIPQNATINSYDGPFRYAGKVDGAAVAPTSPADITSLYPLAAGQKQFCMFRIVRADGRLSAPFRANGSISA